MVKKSVVRTIMKVLILLIGIVAIAAGTKTNAQHPLSLQEARRIEKEVANAPISVIADTLAKEQYEPRRVKIIQELGNRTNGDAITLLHKIERELSEKPPEKQSLRAVTLIAIAKVEAESDQRKLIESLEKMLSEKSQPDLIFYAATELCAIGTPEARDALLRHEKGNQPMVKFARLQIDFDKLDDESFASAILASAKQELREHGGQAAPPLVAEDFMLTRRTTRMVPFLKKELENARNQIEDSNNGRYIVFLDRVLLGIARAENTRKGIHNTVDNPPAKVP